MSRLTDKNVAAVCGACSSFGICKPDESCFVKEVYAKLKRLEDLEEAGRLITLPCKLGDKVYDISDVLDGDESDILVIDVKWITLEEDENGKLYFDISGFDYYPEDFGNVAFLTEDEAYAELSRIFQAMQDELEAEAEWVAMEGGEQDA